MTHPVQAYIDATAARLRADGCQVSTEDWGGTPVVVSHRSDFRLQWMATTLHLFACVAPAAAVTQALLERFADTSADYAVARKGQLRGLQSGIATFPTLVSKSVDPAAQAWAESKQRVRFACTTRPVVVDVSRREVSAFRGNPTLGRIYSAHLRRKLDLYLPRPS